jgi:hypothetical protein
MRSVYVPCCIKFVDFDVVRLIRSRDEVDAGELAILRHGVTDGASRLGIWLNNYECNLVSILDSSNERFEALPNAESMTYGIAFALGHFWLT